MQQEVSVQGRALTSLVAFVLSTLVAVPPSAAFDRAVEAENYSKGQERQAIYNTPEYQAKLRAVDTQNRLDSLAIQARDPERNFIAHVCASGETGTSHAPKQDRRVKAGLNSAYNPSGSSSTEADSG